MESVKEHILQLENNLLKVEIRKSAEKTSELLADNFTEFCSSGHIYNYNKLEPINEEVD